MEILENYYVLKNKRADKYLAIDKYGGFPTLLDFNENIKNLIETFRTYDLANDFLERNLKSERENNPDKKFFSELSIVKISICEDEI